MPLFLPVANVEDVLPFMIPILALMIPIVAILVSHQQKMAQIIHGAQRNQVPNAEIEALRREVRELKEIVHQQTIAVDGMQGRQLPPSGVAERLSEV